MNTKRFVLIFSLGLAMVLTLTWALSDVFGPVHAFMYTAVTSAPGIDGPGVSGSREFDAISLNVIDSRTQSQMEVTPTPISPDSDSFIYLPVTLNKFRIDDCQYDDGTLREYFPFQSPYISHAVQIDGKISSNSEWSQAVCMDLRIHEGVDPDSPNVRRAHWWVQNDGQFAYYLARVPKNLSPVGVAVHYFWPEYTGTWAHSDGVYVNIQGEYLDLANWDEEYFYEDVELTPPGTIDVEAAASQDMDFYWFEIKKDLNSGDQYDWAVAPGQTVGHNPLDSFLFALIFEEGFFTRSLQMHIGEP